MSMTDREKACRVISIISSEEREPRSGCVDELKLECVCSKTTIFTFQAEECSRSLVDRE